MLIYAFPTASPAETDTAVFLPRQEQSHEKTRTFGCGRAVEPGRFNRVRSYGCGREARPTTRRSAGYAYLARGGIATTNSDDVRSLRVTVHGVETLKNKSFLQ